MKIRLPHLFLGLCSLVASLRSAPPRRAPAAPSDDAILRAIAEKETGSDPRAVGRLGGERSQYQFTLGTWRLHTHRPFADATFDPAHAHHVAHLHLAYLRSVLRLRRLPDDAAHLAAAWHYGPQFACVCLNTEYVRAVLALLESEARP